MYDSVENKNFVKSHSLIDVTLRDGGFCCDFNWSFNEMTTIVSATSCAPVEFVEIGYVGGLPELHSVAKPGSAANLTNASIKALRHYLLDARICVMVHPGALCGHVNFEDLKTSGVDLVRFVYHKSWREKLTLLNQAAKDAGLKTSVNIALLSHISLGDLLRVVESLNNRVDAIPDIICLADTCGAMFPDRVSTVVRTCVNATSSMVGFHAHDYLSLALANSLSAVDAGAQIIDVSLLGIGRGAGNLRLELWEAATRLHFMKSLQLRRLARAHQVITNRIGAKQVPDLISILCGSLNLKPPEEELLRSKCDTKNQAVFCQVFIDLLQECTDLNVALHKI
ncbi:hypothetical protein [Methylomicrobium lacus]|uniref:hypothetical protein n=1 Tax=Methylomicrobium lacus TaxID=136992 RepID=UPI0035A8EB97